MSNCRAHGGPKFAAGTPAHVEGVKEQLIDLLHMPIRRSYNKQIHPEDSYNDSSTNLESGEFRMICQGMSRTTFRVSAANGIWRRGVFVKNSMVAQINPRPCTPIFIARTCRGRGSRRYPPRVSKLKVVELSGKKLSTSTRGWWCVFFLVLDQYLTQL